MTRVLNQQHLHSHVTVCVRVCVTANLGDKRGSGEQKVSLFLCCTQTGSQARSESD